MTAVEVGESMVDELSRREKLSALADGQLQGDELAQALQFAAMDEGLATWRTYQVVGDILRSPELAKHGHGDWVGRLRAQLEQEPRSLTAALAAPEQVLSRKNSLAANDPVFRWKMVAGLATLAAVVVIGWNAATGLQQTSTAPQLASAPAVSPNPEQLAKRSGDEGSQLMLRDPRLDELLAARQQFGNTAALQLPADFLRNANFESPGR